MYDENMDFLLTVASCNSKLALAFLLLSVGTSIICGCCISFM